MPTGIVLHTRLRQLPDPDSLPALDPAYALVRPAIGLGNDQPPLRILLLYGSLRKRSFSRLATEEAARLLRLFGAETRILILPICRCPIRLRATTIPPSMNCARCRCGRKARSGAVPSGTAPSPAS